VSDYLGLYDYISGQQAPKARQEIHIAPGDYPARLDSPSDSDPYQNLNAFTPDAATRLAAAGLTAGGFAPSATGVNTGGIDFSQGSYGNADSGNTGYSYNNSPAQSRATSSSGVDWRLKISCKAIGLSGILSPLAKSNGVIFPITPTVNMTYQANYSPQRYTHSNYPMYSYENSEVQAISVSGEFTAQNKEEAAYVLACIYFFRATTKMFFGSGANAGSPPPIVRLKGYGDQYLPNVPCIVTQFAHIMPQDVDYISSGTTRIPTVSTISLSLQPLYSKATIKNFDLQKFASGGLVGSGFL